MSRSLTPDISISYKSIQTVIMTLIEKESTEQGLLEEIDIELVQPAAAAGGMVDVKFDTSITGGKVVVNPDHIGHVKVINKILFSSDGLNLPYPTQISNGDLSSLLVGDIIKVHYEDTYQYYPYYFIVTKVTNNDGSPSVTTWPRFASNFASRSDTYVLANNESTISNYMFDIIRPNYESFNPEEYNDEYINQKLTTYSLERKDSSVRSKGWISRSKALFTDRSTLQIGDIKFFVDPTQISFMTQNGYQFFPTIRTQGNPKIPTMQEVKTVNITLIFPNQDTVNNNLIPLLAMFKRTPFVNIRNLDILSFFDEIIPDYAGFLPVALEGIQIQSIEGFPDSLQANISLLPFQSDLVTERFRVLRTLSDVQAQQWYYTDNSVEHRKDQAKSKLNGEDFPSYKELKEPILDFSENFEDSIPFRSYYQALLKDRDVVLDDRGNVVFTGSGERIPLDMFRPSKDSSYISNYESEHNTLPIRFSYRYIASSLSEFARNASVERRDISLHILEDTRLMMNAIAKDPFSSSEGQRDKTLADILVLKFTTSKELIAQAVNTFKEPTLLVQKWMTDHNVRFSPIGPKVENSLVALIKLSATNSINDIIPIREFLQIAGLPQTISAKNIESLNDQIPINLVQELSGTPDVTTGQYVTGKQLAEVVAKVVFNYISGLPKDSPEVRQWAEFFNSVLNNITTSVSSTINASDPGLGVQNLPLEDAAFLIDNTNDVVVGWSMNFTNKFIPMYLSGAKYPFYQHIGSDDINMSLRIHSIDSNDRRPLRDQLSILNDRLQNNAKLVLLNAPELAVDLDPRLTIDVIGPSSTNGNIFNAFGIQKAVYNNSRVSNIQGSPGSWDITLNLTQANFTVREYHEVEPVQNHADVAEDILNLIIRANYSDDPTDHTGGRIEICKYKLEYKRLINDLSSSITNQDPTITNALERSIGKIGDLPEVVYFGALDDTDGTLVNRDIIRKQTNSSELLDKRQKTLQNINKQYLGFDFFHQHFASIVAAQNLGELQRREDDIEKGAIVEKAKSNGIFDTTKEIGKKLLGSITNTFSSKKTQGVGLDPAFLDDNIKQMANLFNDGYITRVVDKVQTDKMRAVFDKNPELEDIIKFLVQRRKELNNTEYTVMLQVFSYMQKDYRAVWKKVMSRNGFKIGVPVMLLSILALWIVPKAVGDVGFIGAVGTKALQGILVTSAIYFAGDELSAKVEAIARRTYEETRTVIANSLNGSISNIFSTLKYSFISKIGERILKDPVVLEGLFGQSYAEEVYDRLRVSGVNCYPDFDIPVSFKTTWINKNSGMTAIPPFNLDPDFYLYNLDVSKIKKTSYVQDAVKQAIAMGKLSSFTTLLDYKEALEKFKILQNQFSQILPTKEIETRLLAELNFSHSEKDPTSKTYLDDLINDVQTLYVDMSNELKAGDSPIDPSKFKFNLIAAARMNRVIDLLTAQAQLNLAKGAANNETYPDGKDLIEQGFKAFIQDNVDKSKKAVGLTVGSKYNITDQNSVVLNKMFEAVNRFISLDYFKSVVIPDRKAMVAGQIDSTKVDDELKDFRFNKESLGVSQTLDRTERYIYKIITDIIVMSNALWEYQKTADDSVFDVLTEIPEIQLLNYYNWRFVEDLAGKQTELLRDIANESINTARGRTKKMFPTFKIYFVEEDNGIVKKLDDYYSYNAIQSIEIVSNKYAASKTAVISLSNVTNSLTNPLAILKESGDILHKIMNDRDNIFFGHLDVKPGTKIIIKMGYDANDANLPVRFVGRVIEMSPGTNARIVAQSYGAQLNHEITKLNFGFWSTENGMGDVSRVILDTIPGLEGLGTSPPTFLGSSIGDEFGGRNYTGMNTNFIDKFLLSNLMSDVHANLFAMNNPRDDNVFLQYDYFNKIGFHKDANPTFDWIVYQQTAWQALSEICLYNRNTFPLIKLYNDDPLASMKDLRETIFLGDKSGFYKFTDSFSLSTKDYKGIKAEVQRWNDLVIRINNNPNGLKKYFSKNIFDSLGGLVGARPEAYYGGLTGTIETKYTVGSSQPLSIGNDPIMLYYRPGYSSSGKFTKGDPESAANNYAKGQGFIYDNAYPFPPGADAVGVLRPDIADDFVEFVSFLQSRYGPLILAWSILKGAKFTAPNTIAQFSMELLKSTYKIFENTQPGSPAHLISTLLESMNAPKLSNVDIIRYQAGISQRGSNSTVSLVPPKIVGLATRVLSDFFHADGDVNNSNDSAFYWKFVQSINPYDVMTIKPPAYGSTDPIFKNNPSYRKIQKHHLITDTSDILNNNITLSNDFNNCVTVYYTDEPREYKGLYDIPRKNLHDLKSWTIKAFGAIKDSQVRMLETYQKNVDTNWWDTRDAGVQAFQKYAKMRSSEISEVTPNWDALPSFATVAVNLMQREVEKMYRGTLEVVGNPNIDAGDIIHMDDLINDMNGPFEVEEVIESFTPNAGYRTIITPCLITYDRDPITARDLGTISNILTTLDRLRSEARSRVVMSTAVAAASPILASTGIGAGLAKASFATAGKVVGWAGVAVGVVLALNSIYSGTIGVEKQYTKSLYGHMANLFGRDCINFSTLFYHGAPYMSGFDGIDYTNMQTVIKQQLGEQGFVTRLASANDTEFAWILSQGDFSSLGFIDKLGLYFPGLNRNWLTRTLGLNIDTLSKVSSRAGNDNLGRGIQ